MYNTSQYLINNPSTNTNVRSPKKIKNWIAGALIGVYYLLVWAPPFLPSVEARWYIPLALSIFAFFILKPVFTLRASILYWVIYGISFLGAAISLFRAPWFDQALWNTVGMGISFVTFLLFVPVLSNKISRRILLFILIVSAFFWVFEIQNLIKEHGTLIYSTFSETGENKNDVGYSMAMAATALLFLAVFWKPNKKMHPLGLFGLKVLFGLSGFYLIYSQALIYARGGLVASITGIFALITIFIHRNRRKFPRIIQAVIFVLVIAVSVKFILPKLLTISPQWISMSTRASNEGLLSIFNKRDVLLEKGIYIISQNPIIGVGLGGSRYPITSTNQQFPGLLIHNTYLTNWAELGILGILSDIIMVLVYIKLCRKRFSTATFVDQIWLLLFIPWSVQMMFMNVNSVVMIAILAGIYYEQYLLVLNSKIHLLRARRK